MTSQNDQIGPAEGPPALFRPSRVVILNDASSALGGATSVALTSADLLRQRGVPVTLISGDDGVTRDGRLAGVEVVAVGSPHILAGPLWRGALRGLHNGDAQRLISRWIAENDTPDTVYHLHTWSKILSPAALDALRSVASRLAVTAHDFFLSCPNGGHFDFQRQALCTLQPMGAACLVKHCDRRHFGHKVWRSVRYALVRRFLARTGDEITILPVHERMTSLLEGGGVPGKRMQTLRNPVTPWRAERITAECNSAFLFVGRLEADKGIDLLAQAARRAGVRLRVVGQGPLSQALAAEFPEVEQLGWRSRDQIAEIARDARALVTPTRTRESFGLAPLEALTSGLPVIVSSHAMIAREVVDERMGLSCDPYDTAALADALGRLARDDDLVAAMSRRALREARRLAPDPQEWVDRLLGIYGGMLATAGGDGPFHGVWARRERCDPLSPAVSAGHPRGA